MHTLTVVPISILTHRLNAVEEPEPMKLSLVNTITM